MKEIGGWRERERTKERCCEVILKDMTTAGVSEKYAGNRVMWKVRTTVVGSRIERESKGEKN